MNIQFDEKNIDVIIEIDNEDICIDAFVTAYIEDCEVKITSPGWTLNQIWCDDNGTPTMLGTEEEPHWSVKKLKKDPGIQGAIEDQKEILRNLIRKDVKSV